jgi:hypothetical protein
VSAAASISASLGGGRDDDLRFGGMERGGVALTMATRDEHGNKNDARRDGCGIRHSSAPSRFSRRGRPQMGLMGAARLGETALNARL